MASPESIESPLPTSMLVISESEAKSLKVGSTVSVTTTGKVLGIRECYGDRNKGMYEVTIENPTSTYPKKEMTKEEMDDPERTKHLDDMSSDEMKKILPKKE